MRLVADLHIHSHYSRATSKNLTFEHLALWAQLKGIQVVATGDIVHPGWLQEMRDRLVPAEEGLFRLQDEHLAGVQVQVPPSCRGPVRFILGGEISNIYKRGEKTRKIHNMVYAPDFAAAERLQARLEKIGNIRADGRPILGLDARDLLEIVLDADPACSLIPAHIWTPWFSLLGSKSGFDSVEECFGDLATHIFALETGLSSDPPMNWRVSALDRYTLVSNSDAHSPEKLGREATVFDTELSYPALFNALRTGDPAAFGGTIEFFPEEGKYHFDGHRACGVAWDPPTTLAHRGLCPVCGKGVTVGVMHRVETLADRPANAHPPRPHPFASLIPLPELLGEIYGVGAGSRRVEAEYQKLLGRLGPELAILREVPLEEIAAAGGERLAEGIGRMRRGEVLAEPGYDGEYGTIRVFAAGQATSAQIGLFPEVWGTESDVHTAVTEKQAEHPPSITEDVETYGGISSLGAPEGHSEQPHLLVTPSTASYLSVSAEDTSSYGSAPLPALLQDLNAEQRAAVQCVDAPLVIVAGPGTGKTRTLTVRIAYLILHQSIAPEAVLAITFTNKAAAEMSERLAALLGPAAARITVKTFHAFGSLLLHEYGTRLGLSPNFAVYAGEDRLALLRRLRPGYRQAQLDATLAHIAAAKERLFSPTAAELEPDGDDGAEFRAVYGEYEEAMAAAGALDFDDLIAQAVRLLESQPDILETVRARYRWISVDEYQDVNEAQVRLLKLLAGPSAETAGSPNLCVIGDPDQAIYGFRGADRRYFLSFAADYPGARVLHLSRNYRSTPLILDAAVQVIRRQHEGETTVLEAAQTLADFTDQVKLDIYAAPTDRAEAEYIVHQIEQMVGGTSYFSLDSGRVGGQDPAASRSFADFAVLYRLRAQSRLLVEAFERSGIPYQTVGETPLFEHEIVRRLLAHLWLLQDPRSRLHLEMVLATGPTQFSPRHAAQLWESIEAAPGPLPDRLEMAAASGHFSAQQRERLLALAGFWRGVADGAAAPVDELVKQAGRFLAEWQDEPLSGADAERLHRLTLHARTFQGDLPAFLEATTLHAETDFYDPRADRVALMTLHAAKGLEFPVVFMAGCEEGMLPYSRPGSPPDVEEERRLFYVGMTRARHKLVLTSARTRFLFGARTETRPSRFVDDIESALKEVQAAQRSPRKSPESTQLSLF